MQFQRQLHSYRAIIARGEHDPSQPDAGLETIGLKAASPEQAARLAHGVTGAAVREVYRQDRGAI